MIERLHNRTAALATATCLGLVAIGGCSEQKPLAAANTCYTDFIGNIKDSSGKPVAQVSSAILILLENTLIAKTSNDDTSGYEGTTATASSITSTYINQYAAEGKQVSADVYDIVETKPFNKAMFSYCIDGSGTITPGEKPGITPESDPLDSCIMIYDKYADAARSNPEELENTCKVQLR